MSYIDTHAHYEDQAFAEDLDTVLKKIREAGCEAVVDCAQNYETSLRCLELADRCDFLYAAVGIHPEQADEFSPAEMEKIRQLAKHPKVVAIGETGLDYYWEGVLHEIQQENFRANVRLAMELGLPVVVHDREAHADTLRILEEENVPSGGAVWHCYSGSGEMAKVIAARGWYFSVGGAATFKNARRVLEALEVIPRDRLMLETDCPYMAPVPHRGERNDSSLIPWVAAKIGEIWGVETQEVYRLTTDNARRFFGFDAHK